MENEQVFYGEELPDRSDYYTTVIIKEITKKMKEKIDIIGYANLITKALPKGILLPYFHKILEIRRKVLFFEYHPLTITQRHSLDLLYQNLKGR